MAKKVASRSFMRRLPPPPPPLGDHLESYERFRNVSSLPHDILPRDPATRRVLSLDEFDIKSVPVVETPVLHFQSSIPKAPAPFSLLQVRARDVIPESVDDWRVVCELAFGNVELDISNFSSITLHTKKHFIMKLRAVFNLIVVQRQSSLLLSFACMLGLWSRDPTRKNGALQLVALFHCTESPYFKKLQVVHRAMKELSPFYERVSRLPPVASINQNQVEETQRVKLEVSVVRRAAKQLRKQIASATLILQEMERTLKELAGEEARRKQRGMKRKVKGEPNSSKSD